MTIVGDLGIVAVTGASGFIGRHLCRALSARGIDVRPWSRPCVNLVDACSVAEAFERDRPKTIFHLAAAGVGVAQAHDASIIRQDISMMESLLSYAPAGARLLYAGSMSEYGHAGLLSEEDCCTPRTAYGVAKLACGHYASAYAQSRGLSVRVARLFGVYGPGEPSARLFPSLLSALRNGNSIAMSDGLQRRDFIHVEDACAAMISLAKAPDGVPEVVNIATGTAVRVRDVAQWVADAIGAPRTLLQFGARPRSPGDEDLLVANIDRLKSIIGWLPPQRLQPRLSVTLFADT